MLLGYHKLIQNKKASMKRSTGVWSETKSKSGLQRKDGQALKVPKTPACLAVNAKSQKFANSAVWMQKNHGVTRM